jgi:hypothetical protein
MLPVCSVPSPLPLGEDLGEGSNIDCFDLIALKRLPISQLTRSEFMPDYPSLTPPSPKGRRG